jgi:hypothetical protein
MEKLGTGQLFETKCLLTIDLPPIRFLQHVKIRRGHDDDDGDRTGATKAFLPDE